MKIKIVAFSLLLLLTQACSMFSGKGATVANEYFQPLANTYINVGNDSATSSNNLKKGFYHYQIGEYQAALDNFNKSNTVGNPRLKLYMAVSQMGLKNYSQAEELLESLLLVNRFEFTDITYWYLALAFLQQEKIPAAESIFHAFATREIGSYKQADSEIILDKLKD